MCKEYKLNYVLDKRFNADSIADIEKSGYAFEEKFEAGDISCFNNELEAAIENARDGDVCCVERISDYLAIKMAYGEAASIVDYIDGLMYIKLEV